MPTSQALHNYKLKKPNCCDKLQCVEKYYKHSLDIRTLCNSQVIQSGMLIVWYWLTFIFKIRGIPIRALCSNAQLYIGTYVRVLIEKWSMWFKGIWSEFSFKYCLNVFLNHPIQAEVWTWSLTYEVQKENSNIWFKYLTIWENSLCIINVDHCVHCGRERTGKDSFNIPLFDELQNFKPTCCC
jgi:hypothetical protein